MAAPEVVNIDPGGDVFLVCGTGEKAKKLHVSSIILSQASAVFKALLSPRFKEGTELSTSASVEIPLPEDDPGSMVILCNVFHMRNNRVPRSLKPLEIMDIAIVTDKYACMEPLKFIANIWIEPHTTSHDPKQLSILLMSSLSFQDLWMFERVRRSIVWQSIGPIEAEQSVDTQVLTHVMEGLEKQRLWSLSEITDMIETAVDFMYPRQCAERTEGPCSACGKLRSFIGHLADKKLWPSSTRKTQKLEDLVTGLRELYYLLRSCEAGFHAPMSPFTRIKVLNERAKELQAQIKLPCFGCIREGKSGLEAFCDHERA